MSGAGEGRPREGDGGSWTAGPGSGRRGRRAWGPGLVALPRALGTPNLPGPSEAGAPGQLEGFGAGATASARVAPRQVWLRGCGGVRGAECACDAFLTRGWTRASSGTFGGNATS